MKNIHPIFQAILAPLMPAKPKIVTVHIYPPIPIRTHDWCAYRDGEEERGGYGYGSTEAEAIADLLSIEDDLS